MVSAIAIIPARYGSTRFPGKPLLRETGRFLIQHTYERVRAARRINRCIVATDDERIADAVRSFGGDVAMTSPDHISGTDRIAEVVREIAGQHNDLVLNVQGDEPEIEPAYLDQLVARMQNEIEQAHGGADRRWPPESCPVGTLACPFPEHADPRDPNSVKVVFGGGRRALYFSRALVPFPRDGFPASPSNVYHLHIGVYAYRRWFLAEYAGWQASALEQIEKLEQLRVLERGFGIAVELVPQAAPGIDTPADYAAFVERWNARRR